MADDIPGLPNGDYIRQQILRVRGNSVASLGSRFLRMQRQNDGSYRFVVAGGNDAAIIADLAAIQAEADKIDGAAVDGLAGTKDSLAYKVNEIEKHFHTRERWFGKRADQSGDNWGEDNLTPFRAISGNGVYGADANDEAKICGADDTPIFAGSAYMDMHRILVVATSIDTHWKIRVIYGTGTMADAITAGQYSEIMVKFDSVNPQQSAGVPIEVRMPRVAAGTKIWAQAKSATDNATIDFFAGGHEYSG